MSALLRAPTAGAGPSMVAVGKETCLLSFKMMMRFESRKPALFSASYAIPPVMAPSPITDTTWLFFPSMSLATAIPAGRTTMKLLDLKWYCWLGGKEYLIQQKCW